MPEPHSEIDERERRYRRRLFQHLTDRPASEVEFFINPRRFDTLRRILGPHLDGAHILNVASGPFAFEFYVAPQGAAIDSLDIDPALAGLHADLVADKLIAGTRFTPADVNRFRSERLYDIVLINDLFYCKGVDFYAVLDKYLALLAPGGRLYFDILDKRAGPIWAFFNKDSRYRRYDLSEVTTLLADRGLQIEAAVPSVGIKGGLDEIARRLLWSLGGITNNMIFMARGNETSSALGRRQRNSAASANDRGR